MNKNLTKGFLATTTLVALLGLSSESYVGAEEQHRDVPVEKESKKVDEDQVNQEANTLEKGLNSYVGLIEKMPDDVADQGIDSGVKWLNENKDVDYDGYKFIAQNGNVKLVPDKNGVQKEGTGACTLAVGSAIAQNAIPWAKILKVKKAAKAMGGIQKMSGKIAKAYKHQRNLGKSKTAALKAGTNVAMRAFPEATRQAVIEFFSLGAVGTACFGW